jgi:hypothetical protein
LPRSFKFSQVLWLTPQLLRRQRSRKIVIQSQPRQKNSYQNPYLENTQHKKGWRVAQGEGPKFKPQYLKKKKKEL